jgi:hypothetical protein
MSILVEKKSKIVYTNKGRDCDVQLFILREHAAKIDGFC